MGDGSGVPPTAQACGEKAAPGLGDELVLGGAHRLLYLRLVTLLPHVGGELRSRTGRRRCFGEDATPCGLPHGRRQKKEST
jgi:hypothetical protein